VYSRSDQRKSQGIRAAADPHTESRFAKLSEVLFEPLDNWPADESGAIQGCLEDLDEFILQIPMDCHEI
jgi:hypothetical protein